MELLISNWAPFRLETAWPAFVELVVSLKIAVLRTATGLQ
jgi:hypothetical protein